jgi:hypothetical protein
MVQWKAYTIIKDSSGGHNQQTVYVQTENDQYFEAERSFKALYGNGVWNIQKINTTNSENSENIVDNFVGKMVSTTLIILMAIVFLIFIRI